MQIDIAKFCAHLATTEVPARFKLDYGYDDVVKMLEEVYRHNVCLRKGSYQDKHAKQYIQKAAKWITTDLKPGLLLYGSVGSGKTTLSDSLLRMIATLRPSESIYRRTALQITSEAKEDSERYKSTVRSKMLFIDDLGIEPETVKVYGNEISPIVELLYYRYEKQLFTIITTNLLLEQMGKRYGPRIEDRFAEMFDRIYFNNTSYRKQ